MDHPTELRRSGLLLLRTWTFVVLVAGCLHGAPAGAAPVKVIHSEGPSRGYVSLSDLSGKVLAYGELTQWFERREVVSRLVFHFDDGSIYDEIVRFSQKSVFRLLSYQLLQKGPSFPEATEVRFDRSGRYEARLESAADGEQRAQGKIDLPEDVSNGMTSILLKSLERGATATTHLVSFDPEPRVLELHLTPEGSDPFWIGRQAPGLVRFEGPFCVDGPAWRVEMAAPTWKKP